MTIIIYGNSLLLDSLETALRSDGCAAVLRLTETHLPDTLDGLPPETIIYDHSQTDPTGLYRLLTGYPGWQLVGLTDTEETWTFKGQKSRLGSSDDVMETVRRYVEAKDEPFSEKEMPMKAALNK